MMRVLRREPSWEHLQTRMGVVVTGNNDPLVLGGLPVADALTSSLPQLVREVVAALADHISVYASLPREQLDGDIAVVVERSLKMFRAVLRSRCQPTEQELAGLRESAARRAEEGVPIDAVLTAYHLGARVCAEWLQRDARPDEIADLLAVQQLTIAFLERVSAAVAAGYFEERRTMFGDEHSARQSLLTDLLEGEPAEAAAQRACIRLPCWYLILQLAIEEDPDEADGSVNTSVVLRRRLRRLRVELERQSSEPVLSMLTADGGIVLIPQSQVDWPRSAKLVQSLASIGGTPVTAGAVATEPAQVAAGAVLAKEILGVARAFGRPPGLYQLADLLVEYQLTRPSAAREQLARLLDPVSADPDLVTTLRTFLDCGHNRQRAARLMHVHPNTVDYRLRKIAQLTGLDATRPQDLPRIVAALAARDSVPS